MQRRRHHHHRKGHPPAAPARPPVLTLIEYDAEHFEERQLASLEEAFHPRPPGRVLWLNIDGLGDAELFARLGQHFGLHPLALEDVQHTVQRPKLEAYDDHFFLVAQMAHAEGAFQVNFEQVSFFAGPGFVITIQEDHPHDVFEPVRQRLRAGRGFGRARGSDYLLYALVDAVIDHFFPVLEPLGDALEDLEEELMDHPVRECVVRVHELKRVLMALRRNVWPMRELVGGLLRDDTGYISKETAIFLRDCYDHCIQIMDVIETDRDLAASMMDIYLSSLGMRTNEIMRVLTVVSTVFIPLTFIVGVYGMNFENMPELHHPYGYFICLGFMLALALAMLYLFRRKKWI